MDRILVVDDDLHIGNLVEEIVTREGCQGRSCSQGLMVCRL